MLERLSILLIDSNNSSRRQVSEILKNSVYKLHLISVANKLQALDSMSSLEGLLDFVIISSDSRKDTIFELADELKGSRSAAKAAYIVALAADQQDSQYVAELVLRGFHGIVCEPFSAENFSSVLLAAPRIIERAAGGEEKTLKTVEYLLNSATGLVSSSVSKMIAGKSISPYTRRSMRDLGQAIRSMSADLTEAQVTQILSSVVKDSKPSNRKIEIRKRYLKRSQAVHPGQRAKALMDSRKLDPAKVLSIIELSEQDFAALLECKLEVDRGLAAKLSRALGQTSEYWLNMQKDFNEAFGN